MKRCTADGCEGKHLARGYCRKHYRAIANPDKPRDRRTQVTCVDCGETVMKKVDPRGDAQRCVPCARKNAGAKLRSHWPSSTLHSGTCVRCNTAWVGPARRKYCGAFCAREAQAERSGSRNRTCRRCGANMGRITLGWYCEPCRFERALETRRAYRKHNAHKRSENHRQRARRFGVQYEPVNPMKVYERDGWRCQLCGHLVDPSVAWPHPRSRSLDHVIPMSAGGGHTYENTQLACLECNIRKGASLTYPARGVDALAT